MPLLMLVGQAPARSVLCVAHPPSLIPSSFPSLCLEATAPKDSSFFTQKNKSCLRWDLNQQHIALWTDALTIELLGQFSWPGRTFNGIQGQRCHSPDGWGNSNSVHVLLCLTQCMYTLWSSGGAHCVADVCVCVYS